MTPEISVVIPTWNGRQYLDACLAAVAAQGGVSAETILVDDASTDGTSEYVRQQYPWVRVVQLSQNSGFAAASNAGAREARGRLVAFLNNDTQAGPDWLAALRRGIDEATGFALATSLIVYMDAPAFVDSAGDGVLRWGGAFKRFHGARAEEASESTEVFGVCGAACLVVKRVFDELGGFDESFFASHEDVDLSYRARLRGYRCRYVADALVLHRGSGTLGKISPFAIFHGQRNLEWMYAKNTPGALLVRTIPGHIVYDMAAAIHFARLGMLGVFLRAKLAALGGLPRVLRERRRIQASRRIGTDAVWRLLEPRWLSIKRREKRFDIGVAGASR